MEETTKTKKEVAKKQTAPKVQPELPSEKKIVLVSSLNEDAINQINKKVAEKLGLDLVVISSEVTESFIGRRNAANAQKVGFDVNTAFDDFLKTKTNYEAAKENALKLYEILTGNLPIDKSVDLVFTTSIVAQKTTLTHKTMQPMLTVLNTFGLIQFTKGVHVFKFIFDDATKAENTLKDVKESAELLYQAISRYEIWGTPEVLNESIDAIIKQLEGIKK